MKLFFFLQSNYKEKIRTAEIDEIGFVAVKLNAKLICFSHEEIFFTIKFSGVIDEIDFFAIKL